MQRLRGGGPSDDALAKWNALSSWMTERWDDIPPEQKNQLQSFAVKMVHDQVRLFLNLSYQYHAPLHIHDVNMCILVKYAGRNSRGITIGKS